jgi:hypothetical protein
MLYWFISFDSSAQLWSCGKGLGQYAKEEYKKKAFAVGVDGGKCIWPKQ